MDQPSPSVYRTKSWQIRRRVLTAVGGLGLVLIGYGLGRWQDTPAAPASATPPASQESSAPPAPSGSLAPSGSPAPSVVPSAVEYAVIQAESATGLSGVETEDTSDDGGGKNVGWINRDDYLRFDNYDFGAVPATRAAIRVASGSGATGRLQIRLDSRDNEPVGELSISNTGDWQAWRTDTAVLTPVTGVHTVFLTFTSTDGTELVNLNWLRFQH
ncbi:MAG TPA: carbohydrate-binding protein [Actinoplanes sp.]|nr:carbohydrate-binding protein [Actinoplanes sp.]